MVEENSGGNTRLLDAGFEYENVPIDATTADGSHKQFTASHVALFRIGICFFVLLVSYYASRMWCTYLGLPSDCQRTGWESARYADLIPLLNYTFVLSVVVDLNHPRRFNYVFSLQHGPVSLLTLLAVSPLYSWISQEQQWPSINDSAVSDQGGTTAWVLLGVGACLALSILGFHVWFCWTHHRPEIWRYLGTRVGLGLIIGVYLAVEYENGANIHLHHYVSAWFLALFARFNHPVSTVLLVLCTGTFVQGIAAYGAAPLVYTQSCFYFTHEQGGLHMTSVAPYNPWPVHSFQCQHKHGAVKTNICLSGRQSESSLSCTRT